MATSVGAGARNRRVKSGLPSKPCVVCGRDFTWRRKWARDWEQVKHCSGACRKGTPRGRLG